VGAASIERLKEDGLGRIERVEVDGQRWIRRVACGGRAPLSHALARLLRRREERALTALAGLPGVPQAAPTERVRALSAHPSSDGRRPDPRDVLVRTWIEGTPLHRATHLPLDFFDELARLVRAVHERGVCHNDLHKEQNVLVTPSGRPAIVDFQLASLHSRRGRAYQTRVRDDLRHVRKHLRRYVRDGRGPSELAAAVQASPRPRRSLVAGSWRRLGKPVYDLATRTIFPKDSEARRPSSGPWPTWGPPVGSDAGSGSDAELHAPEPSLR